MTETPTPGTATPTPGAVTPWYGATAPEAELLGLMQNKGWHEGKPDEIALKAIKSYHEASKLIGVSPDQVLKFPKDPNDAAGMKPIWSRLGVPADAKEYDFTGIKFKDGTELEVGFTDLMRKVGLEANLPKAALTAVTKAVVGFIEGQDEADTAEKTANIAKEKDVLTKSWGANIEANKFLAQRAAAALGVKPEDVNALEGVIGYARVMEMFRTIGEKIGEGRFITNDNGGVNNGIMTREQAVAKKAELTSDKDWNARYLNGGQKENRELQALLAIIVGDDTVDSRLRAGR